jgi:hypothetical protein
MVNESGAISGMRIGRGNWTTQRIPTTVPFRPSQIPHDILGIEPRKPRLGPGDWTPEVWCGLTCISVSMYAYILQDVASGFPNKCFYIFLIFLINTSCPVHLTILYLFFVIIFEE